MGRHHLPSSQTRRAERASRRVIGIARTDAEIRRCHDVMRQLRPHHDDPEAFVARIKLQQREGYVLASLAEDGAVRAVAGYRIGNNLAWGKYLYVDDLVTDTTKRSHGHGKKMLDWLFAQAREDGCDELHLDSGVQRVAAHRFYLRDGGMAITSHHFQASLDKDRNG